MKGCSIKSLFFLLIVFGIAIACENKKAEEESVESLENQEIENTSEVISDTRDLTKKDVIYTWVDDLNIRNEPTTRGEIITKVSFNDPLEFTGERSKESETIVIRGVAYHERWLKIKTSEGKEGWVFGGAVKREGEEKGNIEMTNLKFDFEHFGNFDLSEWTLIRTEEHHDEVDAIIKTYQKGNQIIEFEKDDMGEMYYGLIYTLMNGKREVLKRRSLVFSPESEYHELSETIEDFTTSKKYYRTQEVNSHYYELNNRPIMAKGRWIISELEEEASDSNIELEVFIDYTKFPKNEGLDDGCTCTFRTYSKNHKTTILESSFEDVPNETAVIQIKGEYIVLKSKPFKNPDYKRGDYHRHYYNEQYDLKIVAFKEGNGDNSGVDYTGVLRLFKKDGTEILSINTFGFCGC